MSWVSNLFKGKPREWIPNLVQLHPLARIFPVAGAVASGIGSSVLGGSGVQGATTFSKLWYQGIRAGIPLVPVIGQQFGIAGEGLIPLGNEKGGSMALPALGQALLNAGISLAQSYFTSQAQQPSGGDIVTGAISSLRGTRRRRRHRGLTFNEMGKIMVMGQALGRRSPAVTLMTMRALSGRI